MLIIPAIDLRQGKCVRLRQGRKALSKIYEEDPLKPALQFEREGARLLHVVDLDGAFSDPNSRNRAVLREMIDVLKTPVQFGGGLRSFAEVNQAFAMRVHRVVLGTLAVTSPETVSQALNSFGSERVAVGIDARGGKVMTHGWTSESKLSALELAQQMARLGVERIIYTDIARDGMLTGADLEGAQNLARASGLKVTVSGGIASLEDLIRLKGAPEIDSVIIGKALYEGRFTLTEALRIARAKR